jgi:hypothetical protein
MTEPVKNSATQLRSQAWRFIVRTDAALFDTPMGAPGRVAIAIPWAAAASGMDQRLK